jgi:hypothetical protein
MGTTWRRILGREAKFLKSEENNLLPLLCKDHAGTVKNEMIQEISMCGQE